MSNGHQCRCAVVEPHLTFGQCMRFKNVKVAYCASWKGHDFTRQKKWDNDLEAYASARKYGVQPNGTTIEKVRYAERATEKVGANYGTKDFEKKVIERTA